MIHTNQRHTPETDDAIREYEYFDAGRCQVLKYVEPDFARRIEQQRDALREAMEPLIVLLNKWEQDTPPTQSWRDGDRNSAPIPLSVLLRIRAVLAETEPKKGDAP